MKRITAIMIATLLSLLLLTACGQKKSESVSSQTDQAQNNANSQVAQEKNNTADSKAYVGEWKIAADASKEKDGYVMKINSDGSTTMTRMAYTNQVKNIWTGSYSAVDDNNLNITFARIESYTVDNNAADGWKISSTTDGSFPTKDLTADEGKATAVLEGNTLKVTDAQNNTLEFTK